MKKWKKNNNIKKCKYIFWKYKKHNVCKKVHLKETHMFEKIILKHVPHRHLISGSQPIQHNETTKILKEIITNC